MADKALRIGLIAPYSGTNLGDQAIQAACIGNLRARAPAAEITGIYLNTWRPARLHGIETFPITGLTVPFYSNVEELFGSGPRSGTSAAPDASSEPAQGGWRDGLKRVPGAQSLVFAARRAVNALRNVLREIRWLVRAWRFVGELDLIVVAGSGQFDDEWGGAFGQPFSLACWAWLTKMRDRRFAIASVGASKLHGKLSRTLFAYAVRRAEYVSCRDPASVAMIRELMQGREPRLVYDLASSLPELTAARARQSGPRCVALSPISFGRAGSWPTEAQGIYEQYLRALCGLTLKLARDDWNVVLFTTSGGDGRAVNELVALVREASPELAARLVIARPTTLTELFDALSGCSLVVASRLHGVILSHLLEKPVLAISFDPKVDSHMKQFEQEAFRVDIAAVEQAGLAARFGALEAGAAAVRDTLRRARERYTPDVFTQYEQLIELARAGAT